ncbi:hypothetical protein TrVE_jg361 [Triparma verrucosa]|uniref:histone deacetylase n=1 Tax=Triparma verrucosa TaxID=1606542 RepID=A0A9W7FC91_9STRA|nr:hypothetical protein TrVE_jg361 [Triparma verrucosa]
MPPPMASPRVSMGGWNTPGGRYLKDSSLLSSSWYIPPTPRPPSSTPLTPRTGLSRQLSHALTSPTCTLDDLKSILSSSETPLCVPTTPLLPPIICLATMPLNEERLKILKYFVGEGEDESFGGKETLCPAGFPAFHWACVSLSWSDVSIWHSLIGGTVSALNGDTALHRCARLSKLEVLKELLKVEDPFKVNHEMKTCFDVAGLEGKKVICEVVEWFKCEVLSHADCEGHINGVGHQEQAGRIKAVLSKILPLPLINPSSDFSRASLSTLSLAHSKDYINFVTGLAKEVAGKEEMTEGEGVPFTPRVQREVEGVEEGRVKKGISDTGFSKGSFDASLRAVGGVCHAVDLVLRPPESGGRRSVFVAVRPPGHHAGYEGHVKSCVSCGFCIFNSVAIAAVHALKSVERVAVLDFDVHHGNGTEEIFRKLNRPSELFFGSAHLYDGTFYPGSGGEDDIRMNIVNAGIPPLWKGKGMGEIGGEDYGRAGWRKEITTKIFGSLRAFNPSIILVSLGLDGGKGDIGNKRDGDRNGEVGLDLGREDYMWVMSMVREIAEVCGGRVVIVLEGGYGKWKKGSTPTGEAGGQLILDDLAINASYAVRGLTGDLVKSKVPSTLEGSSRKYSGWGVTGRRQAKLLEALGGGVAAVGSGGVGERVEVPTVNTGGGDAGVEGRERCHSTTSFGSEGSSSRGGRGGRVRKQREVEDGVSDADFAKFVEAGNGNGNGNGKGGGKGGGGRRKKMKVDHVVGVETGGGGGGGGGVEVGAGTAAAAEGTEGKGGR